MLRISPTLTLIVVLGTAAAPPRAAVERGSSRLLIDAVAFDRNGVPVVDLKPEEMEAWIGHFRVPIETFTAVAPRTDPGAGPLTGPLPEAARLPPPPAGPLKAGARPLRHSVLPGGRMRTLFRDRTAQDS